MAGRLVSEPAGGSPSPALSEHRPLEDPTASAVPRRFDPIAAAIGVLAGPVAAMGEIAAARAWRSAIALTMLAALLNGLSALTATAPAATGGPFPSELGASFGQAMALIRSPAAIVLQALVLSPLLLAAWTGVLLLCGRLLGGRGPYSAVLATQGYAGVPTILQAPLAALLALGGPGLAAVSSLLSAVFGIWTLVLQVIGLRRSLGLSTGRATAAILLPIVAIVVLTVVVAVLVVFAALGVLSGNVSR